MNALAARLRGTVIPAVPVPFGPDATIDREAQQRYARWMASQSVGGVAVWAHTGRGLRLTDEQRADVLSCWQAALGGSPVVCGVGVPESTKLPSDPARRTDRVCEHTVAMARAARAGGAAAVMVHPPSGLRNLTDVDRRVVELHEAVAHVGLPVIAFYLYEAASGLAYGDGLVERLLDAKGVIGIKLATLDSVMTFQDVAAVARRAGDRLIITGEDRFLGYSCMLGAEAALIGLAAACTDYPVRLLRHWSAGELEPFVRLSLALDAFARATFHAPMDGYVQRMLWALEAEGVIDPGVGDPFGPALAAHEREAVTAAVNALRAV